MMVDEADIDLVGGGGSGGGRGHKRVLGDPGSPRPNKRKPGPIPRDYVLNRSPSSSPCPSPNPSPPTSPCPSPPPSPVVLVPQGPPPQPIVLVQPTPAAAPQPILTQPPLSPPQLPLVNGDVTPFSPGTANLKCYKSFNIQNKTIILYSTPTHSF